MNYRWQSNRQYGTSPCTLLPYYTDIEPYREVGSTICGGNPDGGVAYSPRAEGEDAVLKRHAHETLSLGRNLIGEGVAGCSGEELREVYRPSCIPDLHLQLSETGSQSDRLVGDALEGDLHAGRLAVLIGEDQREGVLSQVLCTADGKDDGIVLSDRCDPGEIALETIGPLVAVCIGDLETEGIGG